MKYGQYIETKQNPAWKDYYLDYKALKDLIKKSAEDAENSTAGAFSPRTTSLTVQRYKAQKENAEEQFFSKIEHDVERVNKFTQQLVDGLRTSLRQLQNKVEKATGPHDKTVLLTEAQRIGDDFLQLEKFVNINYMGFHKILKKHDKCVPHTPCRQFYIAHLHQQPWVQGNYSDLLVGLSAIYSTLRGDASGQKNEDSAQGFVRSTTKYWVRNEDCSTVKHHVLQHLPVFQFDSADGSSGDAQLINSVYLDNSSLELYHGRLDKKPGALAVRMRWYGGGDPGVAFVERKTHKESWKGEESVKERFTLTEAKVVPFLDGDYTLEQAVADLAARGKGQKEIDSFTVLFNEIYSQIDSKQLLPLVRTQYMRTAFQIPFDSSVRISLDTNLVMIKENPEDGPTCAASGRWYRDPQLPISRTEITRFPHAVLEVKLSLAEGMQCPSWVGELLDSGYLTEVHKFSKFIHGSATLFPEMVRAVPYWVDDESVRASMLASTNVPDDSAQPSTSDSPSARLLEGGRKNSGSVTRVVPVAAYQKKRAAQNSELNHPLLGAQPTLKLMPDPKDVQGFNNRTQSSKQGPQEPGFFSKLLGLVPPPAALSISPMVKIEPKTFFANERTFLAWMHMAITLGSISAAMLGFAAGADPAEVGAGVIQRHLVELISIILLPLAIGICGYALYMFIWRAGNISKKKPTGFDDKRGPLVLCCAVTLTLGAILLLSVADFVELINDLDEEAPPADSPPAAPLADAIGLGLAQIVPQVNIARFLRIV